MLDQYLPVFLLRIEVSIINIMDDSGLQRTYAMERIQNGLLNIK